MEFSEINITPYTQIMVINIFYVILHRIGKFNIIIRELSHLLHSNKTWIISKQFYSTAQRDLHVITDLTSKEAVIKNTNMVCDAMEGLQ